MLLFHNHIISHLRHIRDVKRLFSYFMIDIAIIIFFLKFFLKSPDLSDSQKQKYTFNFSRRLCRYQLEKRVRTNSAIFLPVANRASLNRPNPPHLDHVLPLLSR